ncbi:unnamed protein product [Phytophthora fragariaefolia]|uniref:Unnamed protein product n=1 Tax=Phytophthora fragariaefolia TaxID=1490495 RepID=A0A9W6XV22_9STRA|nr:unnamed protein product [Phytophthora fragariaefolia]
MGSMRIVEPAGFENFVLKKEDKNGALGLMIVHASFLVSYQSPTSILRKIADEINRQLEHEDKSTWSVEVETAGASVFAAACDVLRTPVDVTKRTVGTNWERAVEVGRWTNRGGHPTTRSVDSPKYERVHSAGRVVEDPALRKSGIVVLVTSASRTVDRQAGSANDCGKTLHGRMGAALTGRAWKDRGRSEVTVA